MECVIQSSMFYSFYLFLSILLCNRFKCLCLNFESSFIGNFDLYWLGGGGGIGVGGAGVERNVTQEGSREQMWQSVMVDGRWVKKDNFSVR